ncbi:MAG: 4Fe-4S dicluster domain-containing protein [Chloroflexota bacterium]
MEINETCIACGACLPYCPMSAISLGSERAEIDRDECVECNACVRSGICPADAFTVPELAWPRSLRRLFSDPGPQHGLTGVPGRGTEEMKTNDVTGRYRVGEAGVVIDVGRPGIGTRLREVEKIYRRLVVMGLDFEKRNPLKGLLKDPEGSDFKEEVLDEKVLSIIIEFKVATSRLAEVLHELEKAAAEVDTVFCVGLIDRVAPDGSMPNYELTRRLGYVPSVNAKVNIGIGRPRAEG